MSYDKAFFDTPIPRTGTACEKWDGIRQQEGRELLPLWVADMDFRCAREIQEALVQRASHPVYGYSYQTDEATQAMLDYTQRRHGLRLTAQQQAMMPCVVTGLRAAVLSLTQPGDGVIVQPPVYGPFYASIKDNGRTAAECPLLRREDGGYDMDLDAVEQACKAGAKLMMICNPHNPVGRAWTRGELTALWSVLERYGVTLLSDEIHEDFALEPGCFTPMLSIATQEDAPVVSMTSASKTFNLAGLQQAALFTRNQALKKQLVDAMHNVGVVQGNIFAMAATEAAYRYGDSWLEGLLDYLRQAEKLMRAELAARLPKAVVSPMNATYLAWLDLHAYGMTTAELMKRTYACGVAFTPGTFFGEKAGEGFLRLNFACPHAQTLEGIKRLEKAIKG